MSLVTKIGGCIYCGQIRTIEVDEGITDRAVDMEVTKWYDCHSASKARKKLEKIETAKENVGKLFENSSEDAKEFLKAAVELIGERRVKKISVELDGKVKAQISETTKHNIKVERTENKKEAVES